MSAQLTPGRQPELDEHEILRVLRRQAGVVSRRQVLENGGTDDDIERLLRRRRWATVHRGVYVDHTGPLTWDQRAWAAVLCHAPAVLAGRSAMRAHRMRVVPAIAADSEPIEIAVDRDRRLGDTRGIRVRRVKDLAPISQPSARPPRLRVEHAVLFAASAARSEDAAVAVVADACQEGRTTAATTGDRAGPASAAATPRASRGGARRRRRRSPVRARAAVPPARRASTRPASGDAPESCRDAGVSRRPLSRLSGWSWSSTGAWRTIPRRHGGPTWTAISRLPRKVTSPSRIAWGQVLEPCRLAAALGRLLVSRGVVRTPDGLRPELRSRRQWSLPGTRCRQTPSLPD